MVIVQNFVRESSFDAQIKAIAKTYHRMDDLDNAIEWGLRRNPKQFYNICDDFYLWKTDRLIPDIPQLRILYRYVEVPRPTIYLVAAEEVKF